MRVRGWVLAVAVAWGCSPPTEPPASPADRLVMAIEDDSSQLALRLITEGVPVNLVSSDGRLPLNEAVRLGRDSLAVELLASGANPGARDSAGNNSYDIAILADSPDGFDLLLVHTIMSAGGGRQAVDWMQLVESGLPDRGPRWHEVLDGELLSLGILYVALHGDANQARQLRRAREMVNRTGYHALAVAARWGRLDMVRVLLAIDVQPDLATASPNGYTAISLARLGGHDEIVRMLVAAGARSPI